MPYHCQANEESYVNNLGALSALIEELDITCFVIVGDWNANISEANNLFAKHLVNFFKDQSLVLSSHALFPSNIFTYTAHIPELTEVNNSCAIVEKLIRGSSTC